MNAHATFTEVGSGRTGAPGFGSGDGGMSAGGLGRALWRSRWLTLGLTLAGFLAALAFVLVTPPRYTAEARLLLESRDGYFTRPAGEREPNSPPQIDEQAVVSQVQLLTSRDLAREAVRRLGLVGNPEFDPSPEGSIVSRMLAMVGLAGGGGDQRPEDRIVGRFSDRLLVYPVRQSRVIAVEFSSRDPELAARGANLVAALYLEFQADSKKEESRSAGTWLSTAIDPLRRRVEEAEAKVEAFRARSGLFMGSNNNTLNAQLLSDLSTAANAARTARDEAQTRAKLLREAIARGRGLDIAEVAGNELVRRLAESRAAVAGQIASEGRTLGPRHPRMRELEARLAGLDAGIKDAATKAVRTLENDAKVAQGRYASAEAALDEQKRSAADGTAADVELRALEREAKAQRDQLEVYLARLREASTRDADKPVLPDARVISRAVAPAQPSFPKKLPTLALATIGSLVLGLAFVTARELSRAVPPEPGPGLPYGVPYDGPHLGQAWIARTGGAGAPAPAPPWPDEVRTRSADDGEAAPHPARPRARSYTAAEPAPAVPGTDEWVAGPELDPVASSGPAGPAEPAAPRPGEPAPAGAGTEFKLDDETATESSAAAPHDPAPPVALTDPAEPRPDPAAFAATADADTGASRSVPLTADAEEDPRRPVPATSGDLLPPPAVSLERPSAPSDDDVRGESHPSELSSDEEPEVGTRGPHPAGSSADATVPAESFGREAAEDRPVRETTIRLGSPDRHADPASFDAPPVFDEAAAAAMADPGRPAPVPARLASPARRVAGREPIRTLDVRGLAEHVAALRSGTAGGVVALALAPDANGGDEPLGLARALAELLGTVLVDATGHPTVALRLGGAAGLSDLLEGAAAFGDALHLDRASKLHVMPAGRLSLDLDEDRIVVLGHVVEALKLSYEAVVVVVSEDPDDPAREALTALADTALAAPAASGDDRAREALDRLRSAGLGDVTLLVPSGSGADRAGYASSLVRGVSRPGVAA